MVSSSMSAYGENEMLSPGSMMTLSATIRRTFTLTITSSTSVTDVSARAGGVASSGGGGGAPSLSAAGGGGVPPSSTRDDAVFEDLVLDCFLTVGFFDSTSPCGANQTTDLGKLRPIAVSGQPCAGL